MKRYEVQIMSPDFETVISERIVDAEFLQILVDCFGQDRLWVKIEGGYGERLSPAYFGFRRSKVVKNRAICERRMQERGIYYGDARR